jgi:hypothetical protein
MIAYTRDPEIYLGTLSTGVTYIINPITAKYYKCNELCRFLFENLEHPVTTHTLSGLLCKAFVTQLSKRQIQRRLRKSLELLCHLGLCHRVQVRSTEAADTLFIFTKRLDRTLKDFHTTRMI